MPGAVTMADARDAADQLGIVGVSPAMRKIVEVVRQVAPTEITVLVTGESGTGKEVVARAIHEAGNRSRKPLVTVNSGAIPQGIIESELFGHEKGSFTGAAEQRKGYFELADGGTIFLDEIGELPLSAQVKLLRVLENGEFLRVGSSTSRQVNVRVIAATNKDLEHEVRHERFRTDLFFRLRSVNIFIPPLRERPEDIPALVRYFVDEGVRRNRVRFGGIDEEAMELLQEYRWPGNVRELRNIVESMLVLEKGARLRADVVRRYIPEGRPPADGRSLPVHVNKSVEQAERELILRALLDIKGNILELRSLLTEQIRAADAALPAAEPAGLVEGAGGTLSLEEMERRLITEALERFKGNRRIAARALNISERTLYRKIKEYGVG